jgi:hypothetical protein
VATQRQIESARINGAKSRGPKTLEGTRRSSANTSKQGLTSKTIADPASLDALNAAVALYAAEFRPASPAELLLIDQMAAAKIRQHQAWDAETEAWNRALAAHDGCIARAFQSLADSNELACILRYQTRFRRQYYRAFLISHVSRLPHEPELRNTILPNEPDRSTIRNTILPNEPEMPGLRSALPPLLRNEPDPRVSLAAAYSLLCSGQTRPPRPIRKRAR